MKSFLLAAIVVNAVAALPMAVLIRRDFRRIGRVSMIMAIWSGIAMHGHALATFAMAWLDQGSFFEPSVWTVTPGLLLLVAGGVIIYLGRAAYASFRRVYGLKEDTLIEHGIYKRSRNPQYTGYALMFFGSALAGGSSLALGFSVLFLALIHGYITFVEEPHLKRTFGPSYDAYCSRVARYLG